MYKDNFQRSDLTNRSDNVNQQLEVDALWVCIMPQNGQVKVRDSVWLPHVYDRRQTDIFYWLWYILTEKRAMHFVDEFCVW